MGTNLSGFPVKESCLLLGTPGEGPVSQRSSTRVAAVKSPRSRPLSFHQAHIPSPGMSLIFHPELPAVGDKAVSRGGGSLAAAPDPEPRLSSQISDKRALSSLLSAGAQSRPYASPQLLTFLDGSPGPAGARRTGPARCSLLPAPAAGLPGALSTPLAGDTTPKVCHGQ